MRGVVALFVQIVTSLLIVGALMPALLAAAPAARTPRVGLTIVMIGVACVFGLLRLVWPSPKRP